MNIKIDKKRKSPIYKQIVESIKKAIENNELKEGDKLPSARDLAEQLGITAPTVTRAYLALEDEGILYSRQGKGTFVTAPPSRESESSNAGNKIFLSYARIDEDASYGAISAFKEALSKGYRSQTGEDIDIFFDTDSLPWGSDWRETIKRNIGYTTIFMPFLSPSFFKSANCLGELRSAYSSFKERGMEEAILPIRFVDYEKQIASLGDDELAVFIRNTNWKDLTELQYEDPKSPAYRKEIRDIVSEIVDISDRVASVISDNANDNHSESAKKEDQLENEEEGYIDAIESFEKDALILTEYISAFGDITTDIGDTARQYTAEIEDSNGSFKEKVLIIKRFSNDLKPLAHQLSEKSDSICEYTYKADKSVGTILDLFEDWQADDNLVDLHDFEGFGHTLIDLNDNASIAFTGMTSFRDSTKALRKLSRDLRDPLSTIQNGLDRFLSTETIFKNWGSRSKKLLEQLEELENEADVDDAE